MPEATLKAFGDHGELGESMATDGGNAEQVLSEFKQAGVDIDALGAKLQEEGAKSFVDSWTELMKVIESKSAVLAK
jgi:transaldolase